MPQSRKKPDNHKIKNHLPFAAAASSHREIYIIPEPASKCHMPSAVKLRDAFGRRKMVEVLNKIKAKHHH